jgi:hypothetical protein
MAVTARPNFTQWSISAANDPSALDCYREGLAGWYCASEFDEAALPRFFTDNVVFQFGDYVIGRGRSIGQTLVRGPGEIRRSGLDGVVLLLDLGGMKGDIDGVSVSGRPGTVHVRHLSRPSGARVTTVDAITIAVPREIAPVWLLEPKLHGACIDDGPAVGRVLINHMTALAAAAPGMSVEEGLASVRAALTLAEKAFRNSGRFAPDQTRALYAGIRATATALIDRRLTDPTLGVGSLIGAGSVARHPVPGLRRKRRDQRPHPPAPSSQRPRGPAGACRPPAHGRRDRPLPRLRQRIPLQPPVPADLRRGAGGGGLEPVRGPARPTAGRHALRPGSRLDQGRRDMIHPGSVGRHASGDRLSMD